MVLSLPRDLVSRLLGVLACHCILILLYTWIACGNENPATLNRRTMLDETIVTKAQGRVCYFYSKADRMCQWTDVEEHADEAMRLGWKVTQVVFEGSGHCAHISQDEDIYAQTVRLVWEGKDGDLDSYKARL